MPDGPVVCNAGPLIALSLMGRLDILGALYQRVLVPDAVWREISVADGTRMGAAAIKAAKGLERISSAPVLEPLLSSELGAGEAAVISVAHRFNSSLVLLDERKARRIAEQVYGLRVKGTAGMFVAAKRRGLLPEVRPLLENLALEPEHAN
jgi:predicted nucleic acid-binding protein